MSDESHIPPWLKKAIEDEMEVLEGMGEAATANEDTLAAHGFAARINALKWVLQQQPPN